MRRAAYIVMSVAVAVLAAALAILMFLPSTGRIRLSVIDAHSRNLAVSAGDVAVVVPVSGADLSVGDVVECRLDGSETLRRISAIDTTTGNVTIVDGDIPMLSEGRGDEAETAPEVVLPAEDVVGRMVAVLPQFRIPLYALSTWVGGAYLIMSVACSALLWVRAGQTDEEDAAMTGEERKAASMLRAKVALATLFALSLLAVIACRLLLR